MSSKLWWTMLCLKLITWDKRIRFYIWSSQSASFRNPNFRQKIRNPIKIKSQIIKNASMLIKLTVTQDCYHILTFPKIEKKKMNLHKLVADYLLIFLWHCFFFSHLDIEVRKTWYFRERTVATREGKNL